MDIFEHLGETLRRLRKERGKTLADLCAEAKVGKGQLSRIENGHQEATLSTLAKILAAHGVGRKELFRRYDLVEAEATAIHASPAESALGASELSLGSVRQALDRFDAFVRSTLDRPQPLARGAVELGDYVVFFQVVPRTEVNASSADEPSVGA